MGTTTISLRDEAYSRLEDEKRAEESFSDVVIRLTDSSDTEAQVEELAGELGEELGRAVEESSAEVRESLEMESGR